ncbi:hypothetical protein ACIQMV_04910 [Streptomyces sp. NPDC091412]|uniref:hypothetical protein n=1 Tax=Streptomyces sp. NPDC091412 TaxID=3366002 RepID=UPI0037F96F05
MATTVVTGAAGPQSTATCPVGQSAVSGGYQDTAATSGASQSAPIGGSPATGWQATSNDGTDVTAFVICSP